ncbi:MAG: hypothetical protein COA79_17980 [Planctomycetota bacterium]|nr:MAG: hypothetical protein COA79_17980 [Planctomycetota bacterium]
MKNILLVFVIYAFVGCGDKDISNKGFAKNNLPDKKIDSPNNSYDSVTNKVSSTSLSKFKQLKKGMGHKAVYSIVGKPSRHSGSGISYDVYDLSGDKSIWVAWQKGKASWAFIKNSDNSKTVIFD